jgi:hypothetical protein
MKRRLARKSSSTRKLVRQAVLIAVSGSRRQAVPILHFAFCLLHSLLGGLRRLCPAILHSSLFLLPSLSGGFRVALMWPWVALPGGL